MLITASAPCQIAHLSMDNLAMASTCDCRDLWTCPKDLWCQTVKITFLFPWNATWVDHFQLSFEQLGHAKWPRAVSLGETRGTMRCWGGGCRQRSGYVCHVHVYEFRPQEAHTDVANSGPATQIFPIAHTNNSHQPPLPLLWGNHSFFMPASQTSKLTCFAQAMLGHKISGPSSSQHLPRTNPQCCKCPCNLQATKNFAGWHCRFFWEATELKSKSKKAWFQDACVGQLLWIESGCCSDLTGKKTSPTSKETPNTWVFEYKELDFFGAPGQLRFEAFHQIALKHQPPRQKLRSYDASYQKSQGEHWNIVTGARRVWIWLNAVYLSPQHRYSPHCVGQTLWG